MKFRVSLAVVGGDVFGGVRRRRLVEGFGAGSEGERASSLGLLIILHEEWS